MRSETSGAHAEDAPAPPPGCRASSPFNQKERAALLLLGAALLVGCAVAVIDHYRPGALAEFRVVPGAAEPPGAWADAGPPEVAASPGLGVTPPDAAPPGGLPLPGAPLSAGLGMVAPPVPVRIPAGADLLVDVNAAPAAVLEELPGIGPRTAARILAYREEHGPFATVEELDRVPGIGPRTLERLRPRIRVGPQAP
ncbi:MAG: helix-hairpin-helix domain-containing protein [Candidatus Latescibacterota bacterium]